MATFNESQFQQDMATILPIATACLYLSSLSPSLTITFPDYTLSFTSSTDSTISITVQYPKSTINALLTPSPTATLAIHDFQFKASSLRVDYYTPNSQNELVNYRPNLPAEYILTPGEVKVIYTANVPKRNIHRFYKPALFIHDLRTKRNHSKQWVMYHKEYDRHDPEEYQKFLYYSAQLAPDELF